MPHFKNAASVEIVWTQIQRASRRETIAVVAYCFMPDHLHLVVRGLEETSDLKRFVRAAKQLSGYHWSQVNEGKRLWQRYEYDRILRDYEAVRNAVKYLLDNPLRGKLVRTVDAYPFIGSMVYAREDLVRFANGEHPIETLADK